MPIESVNPATGEVVGRYEEWHPSQVETALEHAHAAQVKWRGVRLEERAALLRAAGRILRERVDRYARLMTAEMGKTLAQGRGEVEKCAWVCDWYAERGAGFLADEPAESDGRDAFVTFRPLGVVLAVMPWNFPFWQVFRFAAPGLMAGNAGVLKHASNVFGCALAIEEVFRDAGFPQGLFTSLVVSSGQVGRILEHPRVAAATLTGSTPAGRAVAAKAGAVLKKTVLELGGSDPYVVLLDADLESTVETCVTARLINAGQSCIAAKRFIVPHAIRREFEELFVERMKARRMGDPLDESVDLGPQARVDLRDELHDQVLRSVAKGAKLLLGGEVPDRPGAWYPPTVLGGVKPGMPAYEEELFGPVAAILEAHDEKDALRIANDSVFGLGAAVFTRDVARGTAIARDVLEAGCCFVNAFVKSDPRLPFGGIKQSGYGRELGLFGIREFVNIKTVYVA